MMKGFVLLAGTVLTVAALSGTAPAIADTKDAAATAHGTQLAAADGGAIVKRRTAMRCISTGLKRIKKKKGNAKKSAALIMKNASMIHDDAQKLFPKGSNKGMTRAKKAIWKDWDKFTKAAASLKKASAKLSEAVNSGGDVKKAMKAMSKACKGCHKPFRGKKKKGMSKVKC